MHESPRFFGRRIGKTADEIYTIWEELGLIEKHFDPKYPGKGYFWWDITPKGESYKGRKSPQGTPTFDYEDIKNLL